MHPVLKRILYILGALVLLVVGFTVAVRLYIGGANAPTGEGGLQLGRLQSQIVLPGGFSMGVFAANVNLDDNRIAGNAQIQYSSCAVIRAQTAAGIGSQLRSRGWLQLFSTSD